MNKHAFATVVLDVDSAITGIDGIAWLAERRGELVARRVASLAADAAAGAIPYEAAYAARLAAIRPRRDEVDALSRAYIDAIDPYCGDAIRQLRRAGVRTILVSESLRHALVRLAFYLGVDFDDVHAVDVRFDALGAYTGFDASSPLLARDGKRRVIDALDIDRPVLAVGAGLDATFESFPKLTSMVLAHAPFTHSSTQEAT